MQASSFWEWLKKYDFSFLILTILIFTIGIFNLYSATHSSPIAGYDSLYKTQLIRFVASLVVGIIISFLRPKTFSRLAYLGYFGSLALLVLVLIMGQKGMGATRWIMIGPIRLQPSEIAKITLVLALARWFGQYRLNKTLGLREIIVPALMAIVPTILIVLEPDLGTGLVLMLIFGVVIFYCGLRWKTLISLVFIGIISGGLMYQFGLKSYQRKRIATFLNPGQDAHGSGYNAIQSKIAIGSGQFTGKGYMNSSQASLNYLPENHTDFVFSIFNEEFGLLGSLVLIGLYVALIMRFIWLSQSVPRIFDSITILGIGSIYFWHTLINMGMVMGLLPIVGLPLPLMSYGGSSLLTFGICLGIVTSMSNRKSLF